jgi:hypothetical protein
MRDNSSVCGDQTGHAGHEEDSSTCGESPSGDLPDDFALAIALRLQMGFHGRLSQ